MNRRFVLLAPALALAALLTTAAAPHRRAPAAPPPLGDSVRVTITTTLGAIEVELDHKHAPLTVENFMRYVDGRRYDGESFYRAMHLAWSDQEGQPSGLIQGGVRDARKLLPPIAHEPTTQTGILHKAGALSLARFAPGTGRADFSILLSDMPGLDAQPGDPNPDRQAGFAAFGHVVSGMDVVRRIWEAPRSATLGQGVMKGQMLDPTVKIISARRAPAPASAP
ncbi:MAG: peptidylprolyl isomerase [Sphingomonadales bacterium]|nr:peptidylprolyl isomerase [Sphingomonadales bacterium]